MIHLSEDHRIIGTILPHFVHQSALFGQAIWVITHANDYDFRVQFEASEILFCRCTKLQNEEFHVGFHHGYERNGRHREDRINACFVFERHKLVVVNNVFLSFLAVFNLLSGIDIVGLLFVSAECRSNHYRGVAASYTCNSTRKATFRAQPVKGFCLRSRHNQMAFALADVVNQVAGNRNFGSRFFAQTHTNGVSDAVR